jgi:hypothetical protein
MRYCLIVLTIWIFFIFWLNLKGSSQKIALTTQFYSRILNVLNIFNLLINRLLFKNWLWSVRVSLNIWILYQMLFSLPRISNSDSVPNSLKLTHWFICHVNQLDIQSTFNLCTMGKQTNLSYVEYRSLHFVFTQIA